MARLQDIDIPYLEFGEAAAPGTPASGVSRIYVKADGLFYSKDDAGTETLVSGGAGGGSVATDAIWDAAGDLAVGTGANTAAKLAAGATSGHVLTSNGSGVAPSWQAAAGGGGIGSFPTLTQQSNYASSSGATPTITLGSTPATADVIFVVGANVQFPMTAMSGGGATWTHLGGRYIQSGSYAMIDLWMGVVGGAPSTTLNLTFAGANTYYIAAAVYRGVTGYVEWTDGFRSDDQGGGGNPSAIPFIPPRTPAKAPLAVAAMFARGQGSPVTVGFTDITTASAGGDRAFLSYLDTSAGTVTAAASWPAATTNQNIVAVAALVW